MVGITPHADDAELVRLAGKLSKIVAEEQAAKAARLQVEEEIIALTGFSKPSGQQRYTGRVGDASAALVLKRPVSRSVNQDAIPEIKKKLGKRMFDQVFRTKYEVIAKGLSDLEKGKPATYLEVAEWVITKPGKVSVTVAEIATQGGDY